MKETVSRHVGELLRSLREEFKALPFDFHSCFFFNPETQKFLLHRKYLRQEDTTSSQQFLAFKVSVVGRGYSGR